MCVIIISNKKSGHIDDKMLSKGEKSNNDGGGIAWINEDHLVEWKKGLTHKEISELIITRKIKFPYVVHFRIASIGKVCPELCHPFEISDQNSNNLEGTTDKGVIFHNGTFLDYEKFQLKAIIQKDLVMYDGENSDSRFFAFFANYYGLNSLSLFKGQKICVLTPKGFRTYGNFSKVDKHLCSNNYFNMKDISYSFGGFSYDNYGYDYDYGLNENKNLEFNKSYCSYCDREKPLSEYMYNDDICDECFLRNNKFSDNDFNDIGKIEAIRYEDKKPIKSIVKKDREFWTNYYKSKGKCFKL